MDTIKARIQINQIKYDRLANISKHGIINTVIRVYQKEGVRGFFRGVTIACMMGAPASCLFFGSYETFKKKFRKSNWLENSMVVNFLSGFGAECVSSFLWVPIDVIKERLQV